MTPRILLAGLLALTATACIHVHWPGPGGPAVVAKKGPPPHAPAHGYRHKVRSHGHAVELVFDADLDLYVVVGWPGHYYLDGVYYRQINTRWHSSARLDKGWARVKAKALPPGLARKGGKGRGPHPAKHGY